MNWSLVRAFFAVLSPLVAKVLFAGILIGMAYTGGSGDLFDKSTQLWLFPLIFITINILPNLILSVIGISLTTGLNKNLIKTLLDYPAFSVLPVFTNFIVGPQQSNCSKANVSFEQDQLRVSTRLTEINTGLTVICYGITICITCQQVDYGLLVYLIMMFSPVLLLSVLLQLLQIYYLMVDRENKL